jgi:hypothetical protein
VAVAVVRGASMCDADWAVRSEAGNTEVAGEGQGKMQQGRGKASVTRNAGLGKAGLKNCGEAAGCRDGPS